jgi:predicted nuclease of restriction endonuclease-like RecB superfamily
MAKVTNEDILRINEVYYKVKTYAETARQTGFAATTVKKYVIPGWKPVVQEAAKRFRIEDIPEVSTAMFAGINNYGYLCTLSTIEVNEIEELWEELAV